MKVMKNYILILLLAVWCTGCNSWLEIDPKDRVPAQNIFNDKIGFLKALNGIYVEMAASNNSYGSDLSYGLTDVLAQYYNMRNNSNNAYWIYANYDYADKKALEKFDDIWSTAYYLIANCNAILEQCDAKQQMLGEQMYPIIKAEALALRAMLHFDILRLYGPVPDEEHKDDPAIPYMTSSDQAIQPLLSSTAIDLAVITDLLGAEELLRASDPVVIEGAKNFPDDFGNNSLNYRQYRLNYFAVKALLARVYLWNNDRENALKYAGQVIEACQGRVDQEAENPLFPFVSADEASDPVSPDRVFSSEVLFSLYHMGRASLYSTYFSPSLNNAQFLPAGAGRLSEWYDDENDYRRKMWKQSESGKFYLAKYEEVSNSSGASARFRYMIPLIRLSEMYLIAAELTDDADYAGKCINKLRFHRGAIRVALSDNNKKELITAEYRREFLGEGQMFFYYKRNGLLNIPDGGRETGMMNMEIKNYRLPLPESETSQRQND